MHLLVIVHSLCAGGAERAVATLTDYWAKKGWQVTVVTLSNASGDFYQLHPTVSRIALDLVSESGSLLGAVIGNLRRVLILRRVLLQSQPDVALAMMSNTSVLLALAAYGIRGVVKLGTERSYPPRMPLGKVWEMLRSYTYGWLDAVVVLTDKSAAWVMQHTRAQQAPVIPNAVQWPLLAQSEQSPAPPCQPDQYRLLAVGRLGREKGFQILISVFSRLAVEFPRWQLFLLGEGSERTVLQAMVDAAGLHDRICLPGRVGDVGQWYRTSDLYVMSSYFEGFPNTLIEAMAHGLPVVSFDCDTGPRDIIRQGIDGLLVPAENEKELESALRQLMSDVGLRQGYAARAIDVRERFSLERVAEMWEKLFSKFGV